MATFLGEFEHLVLATALRLKDGYGAELVRELETRAGREVRGGALYATLDRLSEKGYVSSRSGDPDPIRGGRPRRYFRIEASGVEALRRAIDDALTEKQRTVIVGVLGWNPDRCARRAALASCPFRAPHRLRRDRDRGRCRIPTRNARAGARRR